MNVKKITCTVILMFAISTLLVSQASAFQIYVFAPLNYAGVPPTNPRPFASWFGNVDPLRGGTSLGVVGPGSAMSGFNTGWWLFQDPGGILTQTGSVHADTWLTGTISAFGAGFRVYLWVVRFQIGQPMQFWRKVWSYATPGAVAAVVDLGITSFDLSSPGNLPFQWINNAWYYTRVAIQAFASSGTSASCDAKYDDVLYITYAGSPEPHWVQSPEDPKIEVNPPMGPVGTEVVVNGTGFAPETLVYIYFDDSLVNKTVSTLGGLFESWFNVPDPSAKGPHVVRAIDALENTAVNFFDVFIEAPPIVGDLNNDGRVNILDCIIIANNFGKTDPNVDPPGEAGATDISMSMSTLVLIAAVSIGLFRLRKRTKIDDKANTTYYGTLSSR